MFKGRYYKHQKDGKTLCIIEGTADSGDFVQVITNDRVYQFYDKSGCYFDSRGVVLNLPGIKGRIKYFSPTPLRTDIMGPFRHVPMQCRHSVISMQHRLGGYFEVEGTIYNFTGGKGYIEGDSGRSFPKEYLWLHCNDFAEDCSIMASVADIPFCGFRFWGCICAILYQGKEYRLATYSGVRIIAAQKDRLVLKQGKYKLVADIKSGAAHPLKAPLRGRMTETIHESNASPARFRFFEDGNLLFDLYSRNTSFECNLPSKG